MITMISRDAETGRHRLVRKKPTKHALAALVEFESAAVDLGFIGSMNPDDHDEIELRYKKAKARLIKHLTK